MKTIRELREGRIDYFDCAKRLAKIDAKTASFVRKIGSNSNVNVQDQAHKDMIEHMRTLQQDVRAKLVKTMKQCGFKVVGGRLMREKYRKPTAAEIERDRRKDGKGKNSSDRYSRIKRKMYGNAMGGLKD